MPPSLPVHQMKGISPKKKFEAHAERPQCLLDVVVWQDPNRLAALTTKLALKNEEFGLTSALATAEVSRSLFL